MGEDIGILYLTLNLLLACVRHLEVLLMENLIAVVNKATHKEISVSGFELALQSPSVVLLSVKRSDIKSIERQGGCSLSFLRPVLLSRFMVFS